MNKKINTTIFIFGLLATLSLLTVLVWADSDEPFGIRNINYIGSSRPNTSAYPPANTSAEAGNVTELNLTAIATTKAWQGYYGEIAGVLTLEDSSGYVFYNWTTLEPKGEIYTSINQTITWSNVFCFDWTGQNITLESMEAVYGIEDDDEDGINETYTDSLDKNFFVGTRNITEVSNTSGFSCHATNTYQLGQQQVNDNFENILLTDNQSLIFTTIIENNDDDNSTDIQGFDGQTHDFQLLVAENGQEGFEDTTTTYYFWAEIE